MTVTLIPSGSVSGCISDGITLPLAPSAAETRHTRCLHGVWGSHQWDKRWETEAAGSDNLWASDCKVRWYKGHSPEKKLILGE